MKRIIVHWTAGRHFASALDKQHYHFLVEVDGKVVQGQWAVKTNEKPIKGRYAAHTLNCNSDSVGVALCCMAGAVEEPFSSGDFPMTKVQWNAAMILIANLCKQYNIPVTRETVLSHAEVQGTLKIPQRGKWDITRLSFDPAWIGAMHCGDYMRASVKAVMMNEAIAPLVKTTTSASMTVSSPLEAIPAQPKGFSMNNAIRTILVALTAAAALMGSVLGCTTDAAGATVCTAAWLPPQFAGYAILIFSALGIALKAFRPGGILSGLFGQTAVVSPTGDPGTVTQTQVNSGPKK
jgi:hypothetical protein